MELNLKGKKALVMGASAGIGRSIAAALIKEGVEVAISSRDEVKLKKTADEIKAQHTFVCDTTKKEATKDLVKKILSQLGSIDILVTNTGGPTRGNFLDISRDQWENDFQSLWMSVVESLQEVLPVMQKKGFGRILMVTSMAAKEPIPGLTTSNGLRAGLAGLAKSIANEYARYGITINLLLPGLTNTDRLKDRNLSEAQIINLIPRGKLVEPSEFGALATFLSSDLACSITGQSMVVDGGSLKGV